MKSFALSIFLISVFFTLSAQKFTPNYDESKVPPYKLPDVLTFQDGSPVTTRSDWDRRRKELLVLFRREEYGISPEWHGSMTSTVLSTNEAAFEGRAVRKEYAVTLKNGPGELTFNLLVYLPHSSGPVPVFLGYNFGGNHTVTDDPGIAITSSWMRNSSTGGVTGNRASAAGRGKEASEWQVREIVSRGYGLVTLYYGDIDPDFDDGFINGVHGLYKAMPDSTSWGSIAAWAWGLSRVMDWITANPSIDAGKVIVMGHSRLGKTALWAGATDERFAVVISNNSGCGGAALSKRIFGETVGSINRAFPHWFCENFNKYNEKEEALPFDQHELIALMAPRPVYVASAEEDLWADPAGEFLACKYASPAYRLAGGKGLPSDNMPPVNSPLMGDIGYHIRTGVHDVTLYDWQRYLDFADMHLKK